MNASETSDELSAPFNEHRPLLFSIAYRMLGSVADAEDVVQEAFVRWLRAAPAGVESPRRLLTTIVSRLSINLLKSARVRRETYVGPWLPEPIVTTSGDNADRLILGESISMAFMMLLERLNPVERAVFILRDVFDYGYEEISAILNRSEEHCRQLLHRAHGHLKRERRRFDATPAQHENLLRRFMEATRYGDMQGLLNVLSSDVVLYADGGGKAAAVPLPVFGADKVGRLMIGATKKFTPAGATFELLSLNGSLAIVSYSGDRPMTAVIVETDSRSIHRIYVVSNPDKLSRLAKTTVRS
jgi:RNA polymerase sigma-70 factor (ECF subfamily)